MARHFLSLYLLIVVTLAAVSWGQDRLLQAYSAQEPADDRALAVAVLIVQNELRNLPAQQWRSAISDIGEKSGVDMELFALPEIAGRETLAKLKRGEIAHMQAAGESWALKQLNEDYVFALKTVAPDTGRGLLEWALTFLFYALIALVIMLWIWPLTRDLGVLERAAAHFGDRNWLFNADIKPRSQIYPLAQTFRRMAARIDGLIASHKDMSNAVSHEIKTPLARMQFEIELAQQAQTLPEIRTALGHIKTDIAAINDLVTATLEYAILERADMTLNLAAHNFTTLVPAIADSVRRDAPTDIRISVEVNGSAAEVICDAHLIESVLRNLLYNAIRYAQRDVRVTFSVADGSNLLQVEDDGPGIPAEDRNRAFASFVQLADGAAKKAGFGLGLAIVRRAIEWHGGEVGIAHSPLGGALVFAKWPSNQPESTPWQSAET